jgi:hypothetical protein
MGHFPVSANGSSFDSELFAVDRKIGITADIGLLLGATEGTPGLTGKMGSRDFVLIEKPAAMLFPNVPLFLLLCECAARRFDLRRNHHLLLEPLAFRQHAARYADQYRRGARKVNDEIEDWHGKSPTAIV